MSSPNARQQRRIILELSLKRQSNLLEHILKTLPDDAVNNYFEYCETRRWLDTEDASELSQPASSSSPIASSTPSAAPQVKLETEEPKTKYAGIRKPYQYKPSNEDVATPPEEHMNKAFIANNEDDIPGMRNRNSYGALKSSSVANRYGTPQRNLTGSKSLYNRKTSTSKKKGLFNRESSLQTSTDTASMDEDSQKLFNLSADTSSGTPQSKQLERSSSTPSQSPHHDAPVTPHRPLGIHEKRRVDETLHQHMQHSADSPHSRTTSSSPRKHHSERRSSSETNGHVTPPGNVYSVDDLVDEEDENEIHTQESDVVPLANPNKEKRRKSNDRKRMASSVLSLGFDRYKSPGPSQKDSPSDTSLPQKRTKNVSTKKTLPILPVNKTKKKKKLSPTSSRKRKRDLSGSPHHRKKRFKGTNDSSETIIDSDEDDVTLLANKSDGKAHNSPNNTSLTPSPGAKKTAQKQKKKSVSLKAVLRGKIIQDSDDDVADVLGPDISISHHTDDVEDSDSDDAPVPQHWPLERCKKHKFAPKNFLHYDPSVLQETYAYRALSKLNDSDCMNFHLYRHLQDTWIPFFEKKKRALALRIADNSKQTTPAEYDFHESKRKFERLNDILQLLNQIQRHFIQQSSTDVVFMHKLRKLKEELKAQQEAKKMRAEKEWETLFSEPKNVQLARYIYYHGPQKGISEWTKMKKAANAKEGMSFAILFA